MAVLVVRGDVKLPVRDLQYLGRELRPAMAAAANLTAHDVVERLKQAAPVGNGPPPHLRESFKRTIARPHGDTEAIKAHVVTSLPDRLRYVTKGTGIYGPRHRLIRPVHKKALKWPDAEHPVMWSRGMKANPFVDRVRPQVPQLFEQRMRQALLYLRRKEVNRIELQSQIGDIFGGTLS
jgi:hypothetical protein